MSAPAVDWSQFRDGDRVRVTFEGVWIERPMNGVGLELARGVIIWPDGNHAKYATSAELIERPFTPPAAGKLFRHSDGRLFQSLSENRFMVIRWADGVPAHSTSGLPLNGTYYTWAESDLAWRDAIEVLDI
jgi:hypothetical protein